MGFSHAWSNGACIPVGEWTAICEDTAQLIEAFGKPLAASQVYPSYGHIYLNAGSFGVEHFRLQRYAGERGYCKTEYTAFDVLVCAVLAVIATRWPAFEVTSDGDQAHWQPHLAWAEAVLNMPIPMPPGIEGRRA